jgi:hypothetical protein
LIFDNMLVLSFAAVPHQTNTYCMHDKAGYLDALEWFVTSVPRTIRRTIFGLRLAHTPTRICFGRHVLKPGTVGSVRVLQEKNRRKKMQRSDLGFVGTFLRSSACVLCVSVAHGFHILRSGAVDGRERGE